MQENEIYISELDFKISCILIPFRHKLKRRDKYKLIRIIEKFDYVFTNESDFSVYEKDVPEFTWLSLFLTEGINYITKGVHLKKIAVESELVTELTKDTIDKLSEKYRTIELYTKDVETAKEYAELMFDCLGVPIRIKCFDEPLLSNEGCVVKVGDSITVYNSGNSTEYSDVEIDIMYPLNKYIGLPIDKLLKFGVEKGIFKDIIKKGMVKIIGRISK